MAYNTTFLEKIIKQDLNAMSCGHFSNYWTDQVAELLRKRKQHFSRDAQVSKLVDCYLAEIKAMKPRSYEMFQFWDSKSMST